MQNIFRTIRSKLLLTFFVFLFITLLLIILIFWFDSKKERVVLAVDILENINLSSQTIAKIESDFFGDETINPEFYKTGESVFLEKRKEVVANVKKQILKLKEIQEVETFKIEQDIDSLVNQFDQYELIFDAAVELIKKRGFKDYGLEGEMREYIHTIEDSDYGLDLIQLLTIRRHEKDFIIRKDRVYVEKLVYSVNLLEADIMSKMPDNAIRKELVRLLQNYKSTFLKITKLESEIGFTHKQGLRKSLNATLLNIQKIVEELNVKMVGEATAMRNQINFSLSFSLFFCIFLMVIMSFYITRILSLPISRLSASINSVVANKFAREAEFIKVYTNDEIGLLSKDFAFMLDTVQNSMEEIENKTLLLEREQKLVMGSLKYAKQIQHAILPDEVEMKLYFQDVFVLYSPRDVVSGDFYWFSKTKDKIFIAMVDCTGHGVPGAFMSMIGNTLLNKIVNENDADDPSIILEILHLEIMMALHQERNKNDDGMDMALLCLEDAGDGKKKVTFAGAKMSFYYSKNDEIWELAGNRRSIGGKKDDVHRKHYNPFDNHYIELVKGDVIYLHTDGLTDQPDIRRKKFGKKRLVKLLQEIHSYTLPQQEQLLLETLQSHSQGNVKQRDDITFLAVQL